MKRRFTRKRKHASRKQTHRVFRKHARKQNRLWSHRRSRSRAARGGNPPITVVPFANPDNLAKLLKSVCKDPDNCVALGPYDTYIKHFFNQFLISSDNSYYDLNVPPYDTQPNKLIMGEGANGIVVKVPFRRLEYTACAVLKCVKKTRADNLMFEYFVGKYFINQYLKKVPCFVETYDLYEMNESVNIPENYSISPSYIGHLLQNIQRVNFQLENLQDHFKRSCLKSKQLCLLIQHFNKAITFDDIDFEKIKYDGQNILYQVYFALCMLGTNYTHYDLHTKNVLLYAPYGEKQCILMRYHSNGKIIEFKSDYIAKVIDYGRNYFNNGTITTRDIMDRFICNVPECESNGGKCGDEVGYYAIMGEGDDEGSFYWIDPVVPNMSHDLKLANYMRGFANLESKLIYEHEYGTPQRRRCSPNKICNIFQLKDYLERNLPEYNSFKQHKKYDHTWQVVATMDIYDDGRDYEYNILPDLSHKMV